MSIDVHPNWVTPRTRTPRHLGPYRADLAAVDTVVLDAPPDGDPLAGLSPVVRTVCRLVGQGMPSCEVGAVLGIAESTVKNHLTTAYRKLGIKNSSGYASRRLCFLVGYWAGLQAGKGGEATDA